MQARLVDSPTQALSLRSWAEWSDQVVIHLGIEFRWLAEGIDATKAGPGQQVWRAARSRHADKVAVTGRGALGAATPGSLQGTLASGPARPHSAAVTHAHKAAPAGGRTAAGAAWAGHTGEGLTALPTSAGHAAIALVGAEHPKVLAAGDGGKRRQNSQSRHRAMERAAPSARLAGAQKPASDRLSTWLADRIHASPPQTLKFHPSCAHELRRALNWGYVKEGGRSMEITNPCHRPGFPSGSRLRTLAAVLLVTLWAPTIPLAAQADPGPIALPVQPMLPQHVEPTPQAPAVGPVAVIVDPIEVISPAVPPLQLLLTAFAGSDITLSRPANLLQAIPPINPLDVLTTR